MRSRNIKPGFFKNEKLAELPVEAQLLFIGLWCVADRAGRLEARIARLKAEIYPYKHDASTVLLWCEMLQDSGFIKFYERNNQKYIQIINFDKHQYPHVREAASTIPAPGKHSASTSRARLNPDVLNPESNNLNTTAPGFQPLESFQTIWKDYPRKLGREAASKHFKAQVTTPADYADIQRALANFKAELQKNQTEEKFIPHGSTWFNHKWRDYAQEGFANGTNGSKGTVSYFAIARAKREAEELRARLTPREVSNGGGDREDVRSRTPDAGGSGDDETSAVSAGVGTQDPLESKPDGVEEP